ncbi:MAG: hypothetical protein E6J01_01215 [Chloroflexi bacterium]|nr:MAG: hypothetical protein E6J01_01215 [Chloroflexota bacterium]
MTIEMGAGMKLRLIAPAIAAGALLAACGETSTTSSPSPSPPPVVAQDLVAVAKVTFPYIAQYNYYAVCGLTGDPSQCPYTERLKAHMAAAKLTLCRCQNPASSLDVTATPTQTGGIAHVVLGYGSAPIKLDLVIVRSGGQFLVDDELCTGGAGSTSIYVRSGPC